MSKSVDVLATMVPGQIAPIGRDEKGEFVIIQGVKEYFHIWTAEEKAAYAARKAAAEEKDAAAKALITELLAEFKIPDNTANRMHIGSGPDARSRAEDLAKRIDCKQSSVLELTDDMPRDVLQGNMNGTLRAPGPAVHENRKVLLTVNGKQINQYMPPNLVRNEDDEVVTETETTMDRIKLSDGTEAITMRVKVYGFVEKNATNPYYAVRQFESMLESLTNAKGQTAQHLLNPGPNSHYFNNTGLGGRRGSTQHYTMYGGHQRKRFEWLIGPDGSVIYHEIKKNGNKLVEKVIIVRVVDAPDVVQFELFKREKSVDAAQWPQEGDIRLVSIAYVLWCLMRRDASEFVCEEEPSHTATLAALRRKPVDEDESKDKAETPAQDKTSVETGKKPINYFEVRRVKAAEPPKQAKKPAEKAKTHVSDKTRHGGKKFATLKTNGDADTESVTEEETSSDGDDHKHDTDDEETPKAEPQADPKPVKATNAPEPKAKPAKAPEPKTEKPKTEKAKIEPVKAVKAEPKPTKATKTESKPVKTPEPKTEKATKTEKVKTPVKTEESDEDSDSDSDDDDPQQVLAALLSALLQKSKKSKKADKKSKKADKDSDVDDE